MIANTLVAVGVLCALVLLAKAGETLLERVGTWEAVDVEEEDTWRVM